MEYMEVNPWIRRFELAFLWTFCSVPLGPVVRYLFFAVALFAFIKAGGVGIFRSLAGRLPRSFRWGVGILMAFGMVAEVVNFRGIEGALKGYTLLLEPFIFCVMGTVFFARHGNLRAWVIWSLPVAAVTVGAAWLYESFPWGFLEVGGALTHKGMWYAGAIGGVLGPMALLGLGISRGPLRPLWWCAVLLLCSAGVVLARSSASLAGFAVGCGVVVLGMMAGRSLNAVLRLVAFAALVGISVFLTLGPEHRDHLAVEIGQIGSIRQVLASKGADRQVWLERFTTHRNVIWAMGTDLFRQRPIWGWGLGRLDEICPRVENEALKARWFGLFLEWPSHLHNDLLEFAVSMGVFGVLGYCLVAYGFLRMSFGLALRYGSRHPAPLGVAGAVLGVLVSGMASGVLMERSTTGVFLWTLWGVLMGLYCRSSCPGTPWGRRYGGGFSTLGAWVIALIRDDWLKTRLRGDFN